MAGQGKAPERIALEVANGGIKPEPTPPALDIVAEVTESEIVHQSLDGKTPDEIYFNNLPQEKLAA